MNVNDVCTHDHLVAEVHSAKALAMLLPPDANGSSEGVRTLGLEDTLEALKRRSPPIREGDLENPSELKRCVLYATLMRLEFAATTSAGEGDVHWAKYKRYRDCLDAEINGFTPTLSGGALGAPFSIAVDRA